MRSAWATYLAVGLRRDISRDISKDISSLPLLQGGMLRSVCSTVNYARKDIIPSCQQSCALH